MPSPFPGMDPYLEGDLWSSFHALFVPEIIRLLTPNIRPKYVALAQKYHIVVDASSEPGVAAGVLYPDVAVNRLGDETGTSDAGVMTAPLVLNTVIPERVPHLMIQIRDTQHRHLVTAIEFMSPVNKIGRGRREYLRKRNHLLRSSAHLLEIDLIHAGRRVPMIEELPADPYFVFLSRAGRRPRTEIWPIRLDQLLPAVPVPLLRGDADVLIDLQKAFTSAYDLSGFDAVINFAESPPPALCAEEEIWLDSRLKSVGVRAQD